MKANVNYKNNIVYILIYGISIYIFIQSMHNIENISLNIGRFDYRALIWATYAIVSAIALLAFIFALMGIFERTRRYYFPIYMFGLIVAFTAMFVQESFGYLDVNSIIFHIKTGLHGVTPDKGILLVGINCLIALLSLSLVLYLFGLHSKLARKCLNLLTIPLLLLNPFSLAFAKNIALPTADLSPDGPYFAFMNSAERASENQRNILHIYLESTELTFSQVSESTWAMEPLRRLAKQGFEARGIEQVEATGWTIAGIVASQCGVPLVYPLMQRLGKHNGSSEFLPGVVCLTDILAQSGYSINFLHGFNLEFAGTETFLRSHSYSNAIGLLEHEQFQSRPVDTWGVYDDDLVKFASEEIERLVGRDVPYYLALTTNGGHFPDGTISPSCREIAELNASSIDIVNGIACSNFLIESFLKSLQEKGLLENTVVVLQSDHLVMLNPLSHKLDKHKRANFFAVLGDDLTPMVSDKRGSMLDVYPTILEFAGYKLEDRRAGLGVSLLAEELSLLEVLGRELFDHSLVANKDLSSALWAGSLGGDRATEEHPTRRAIH